MSSPSLLTMSSAGAIFDSLYDDLETKRNDVLDLIRSHDEEAPMFTPGDRKRLQSLADRLTRAMEELEHMEAPSPTTPR